MARPKIRKTRDELIASGIKMYRNMVQYRIKYESGELDDDDIYQMACDWADKQIEQRESRLVEEAETRKQAVVGDDEYRSVQEEAYRSQYHWEGANDESSLQALLNLEVQIKRTTEELEKSSVPDDKDKLRRSLVNTTKEHRQLQQALGIDRLSRAKSAAAKSNVDDWERIKQEAEAKLQALAAEFEEKATKVSSEAELRDRMKYHFAIPFYAVDAVLANHRRVLGLSTEVQKS